MVSVRFLSDSGEWPWHRQFPSGNCALNGVTFIFDGAAEGSYDFLVVFNALPQGVRPSIPRERRIFVASEPANVKRYNPRFLAQFGLVLTTDRETKHGQRLFTQVGLPWHVGVWDEAGQLRKAPLSFAEIEALVPEKTKLVSVVSSNKAFTEEHRARLQFVHALKDYFGDSIDVFGRGLADFRDKLEVLAPYRYHIALENCVIDHYWTEKLADPFLTLTYPLYHGCRNIGEYFPEGSLTPIDIYDADAAIRTIKRTIESDTAEVAWPQLEEARRRVLYQHNLFALLARVIKEQQLGASQSPADVRQLYPESDFKPLRKRLRTNAVAVLKRSPAAYFAAKRARQEVRYLEAALKDAVRKVKDIHYRSHQAWLKHQPDENLRYQYPLDANSLVFDVGGYRGDFAARLLRDYGSRICIFEPVPRFAEAIRSRFVGDARIEVVEAALSDHAGTASLHVEDDATGFFGTGDADGAEVHLIDAVRFLREKGIEEVDLAKLNIEGAEYDLLDRLIASGCIGRIKHLQVQFHLNVPDAKPRYRKLARKLRRTHRLAWRYPFVWESWVRRDA